MKHFAKRELGLLLSVAALVVLLNVPFGSYVLYPFALFSTWIHELCHGLAALAIGGEVERLQIFADTSGLALTRSPRGRLSTAVVASAGYLGTSAVGALLLAQRHRKSAGRLGVPLLGAAMLASALVWVRNPFGFAVVVLLGVALIALGRALKRETASWLFTFLAATICLNAIGSIRTLFGSELVVDGRRVGSSDAHTVAEALFLPAWFWASCWLVVAVLLSIVALDLGTGRSRAR